MKNKIKDIDEQAIELNKDVLLGTIIGDVVGSRFELVNNKYGKEFEFFAKSCRYTDDSVMALAVANAIVDSKDDFSTLKANTINSMVEIGRKYPDVGYGPKFYQWLINDKHEPYGSFGNGAAMRISPVGVSFNNIDDIKKASKIITDISHNHIDSEIGSEAIAIAIYMAINGSSKDDIKKYIEDNYFVIEDLRDDETSQKIFHINCIETAKQALDSFMKSYDFEDAIRNAISLGGDSDTIAAITGGLAAAYYGIPREYCEKVLDYLDDYLINIYKKFNEAINKLF